MQRSGVPRHGAAGSAAGPSSAPSHGSSMGPASQPLPSVALQYRPDGLSFYSHGPSTEGGATGSAAAAGMFYSHAGHSYLPGGGVSPQVQPGQDWSTTVGPAHGGSQRSAPPARVAVTLPQPQVTAGAVRSLPSYDGSQGIGACDGETGGVRSHELSPTGRRFHAAVCPTGTLEGAAARWTSAFSGAAAHQVPGPVASVQVPASQSTSRALFQSPVTRAATPSPALRMPAVAGAPGSSMAPAVSAATPPSGRRPRAGTRSPSPSRKRRGAADSGEGPASASAPTTPLTPDAVARAMSAGFKTVDNKLVKLLKCVESLSSVVATNSGKLNNFDVLAESVQTAQGSTCAAVAEMQATLASHRDAVASSSAVGAGQSNQAHEDPDVLQRARANRVKVRL